jgi:hypothetical protein
LCKYFFLSCVPLFSYMDSKGHHIESSHPLGVSCLFTNHHIQMNHHAPSWTWCTQTNLCTHQPSHPLGPTCPNLGVILMPSCPNLFGSPIILVVSTP